MGAEKSCERRQISRKDAKTHVDGWEDTALTASFLGVFASWREISSFGCGFAELSRCILAGDLSSLAANGFGRGESYPEQLKFVIRRLSESASLLGWHQCRRGRQARTRASQRGPRCRHRLAAWPG